MEKKYIKTSKSLESILNECVEEKETTINILGNSNTAIIYTSDNVILTKMKKILDNNPNTIKCWEAGRLNGRVTGYFFELPKKHISIRNTVGREMSEEAKAAFGERVKKMHAEGKLGNKK